MAAMVIQRLGVRPMTDARPISRSSWSCDATGRASSRSPVDLCTDCSSRCSAVTRSCSALTVTQTMFACIDQHVDQSTFALFESVCACMCVDCIDVCFESHRLPAKKDFTRWKPVQLASGTYDNTPTLALLEHFEAHEDHKCIFCQALRSWRSWWRRDLFQYWQTLSRFFLDLSTNVELIFWWKNSQDTALQEIPRRNSVLYFWAGPSLVEVAVRTASWLVSAISHRRSVCAPMLMLGKSEFLELGRARR